MFELLTSMPWWLWAVSIALAILGIILLLVGGLSQIFNKNDSKIKVWLLYIFGTLSLIGTFAVPIYWYNYTIEGLTKKRSNIATGRYREIEMDIASKQNTIQTILENALGKSASDKQDKINEINEDIKKLEEELKPYQSEMSNITKKIEEIYKGMSENERHKHEEDSLGSTGMGGRGFTARDLL